MSIFEIWSQNKLVAFANPGAELTTSKFLVQASEGDRLSIVGYQFDLIGQLVIARTSVSTVVGKETLEGFYNEVGDQLGFLDGRMSAKLVSW